LRQGSGGHSLSRSPAGSADFVGGDPESNANECQAAWGEPHTGDFLLRGETVTDLSVLIELNGRIGKSDDESDAWLPARMAGLIRQVLGGYVHGPQEPGQHTLRRTPATTASSVTWFQTRDSYAQAGEDTRRLPRASAADRLLPGADCFAFDHAAACPRTRLGAPAAEFMTEPHRAYGVHGPHSSSVRGSHIDDGRLVLDLCGSRPGGEPGRLDLPVQVDRGGPIALAQQVEHRRDGAPVVLVTPAPLHRRRVFAILVKVRRFAPCCRPYPGGTIPEVGRHPRYRLTGK
jgi:hypothetical protein